ncbi:hypothetical protein NUW54_g8023 [Trametes sanguinea]|uniref:Uncharacterized protein n=1 Tax=Trametes sanguinea TaxID=158606 RepID=A0ACC1PGD0_9APHY|nr:hypothetical protein NUW54_g8023 [Trametes sanguinea]
MGVERERGPTCDQQRARGRRRGRRRERRRLPRATAGRRRPAEEHASGRSSHVDVDERLATPLVRADMLLHPSCPYNALLTLLWSLLLAGYSWSWNWLLMGSRLQFFHTFGFRSYSLSSTSRRCSFSYNAPDTSSRNLIFPELTRSSSLYAHHARVRAAPPPCAAAVAAQRPLQSYRYSSGRSRVIC